MFHKNVLPFAAGFSSSETPEATQTPAPSTRLTLVSSGGGVIHPTSRSPLLELVSIAAHRCSSFFAEASVLVLVLALLDRFMLKGRLEPRWIISAFTLSIMLLTASIATDFSARRWLQRH